MAKSWAEEQVRALVAAGVRIEDAQATVNWVLNNAPDDADVATWQPVADLLVDQIDQDAARDARDAWYEWTPKRFKRILDAVDEEVS